ncbi:isomerase [Marivita cryptomonadis]|uniref:mandelate racemase/muconate lactonizing enzyme family protein n=1 Tax=Marivita cryptomonadis TaxID=505252 RepID=UPI000A1DBF29|nr:mandelate racemase/muconate lactonizing enzyme family protein [Marivita cryptomonadis]OSQ55731.1 isomerase [Marivita cryptomonadis]
MKITAIETFLMHAGAPPARTIATNPTPESGNVWNARNWLFLRIQTDAGITGIGECSGWPRVIETAVKDLTPLLIGQDPTHIERIWQRMMSAMMGHGVLGTVGSGAMTGIDMALWDIKGKALETPVWNLLGGQVRDRIRVYGHAGAPERALDLVSRGFTAIKTGGLSDTVERVDAIRAAVGPDVDLMVDMHGPPWMTTKDAILLGRALEPYNLLFYEDPVAPENRDGLRRVQDAVQIPIAAGERLSTIWGERELIEQELVDVIQPDTGRTGGITQMRKIAAMAEAHFITVAPHSGSLGPVAEYAALHLMAAIPNALILERVEDDVPVRQQVILPAPKVVDGHIEVPNRPGLGVDIDEAIVAAHPSMGNLSIPGHPDDGAYAEGTWSEHVYFQSRARNARRFGGG